ncbi:DNA starvation/stationary phase protection protein [uncultured Streptococcus sp.]|uniref:Dps family protein n=1 Tax=uncultured Streptococcus sp. TaxID=83427 RepID=UPI003211B2E4
MLNDKLNVLLANYAVEAHKIHNFHWYVSGPSFYNVHTDLDEVYGAMYDQLDEVAELILMNDGSPLGSMNSFLKNATLSEAAEGFKKPQEIFDAILADYEAIRALAAEIKKDADAEDNFLVSAAMDEHIALLSKTIWMIKQSNK